MHSCVPAVALRQLTKTSAAVPVFTMFYENSCSHCYKAKRVFEQAAGFFHNFVAFAKVLSEACSSHVSIRWLQCC